MDLETGPKTGFTFSRASSRLDVLLNEWDEAARKLAGQGLPVNATLERLHHAGSPQISRSVDRAHATSLSRRLAARGV